jgi:hypothetical protein
MEPCVHSGKHAAFGAEARVPSFFIEVNIFAVEFVEEV